MFAAGDVPALPTLPGSLLGGGANNSFVFGFSNADVCGIYTPVGFFSFFPMPLKLNIVDAVDPAEDVSIDPMPRL